MIGPNALSTFQDDRVSTSIGARCSVGGYSYVILLWYFLVVLYEDAFPSSCVGNVPVIYYLQCVHAE